MCQSGTGDAVALPVGLVQKIALTHFLQQKRYKRHNRPELGESEVIRRNELTSPCFASASDTPLRADCAVMHLARSQ